MPGFPELKLNKSVFPVVFETVGKNCGDFCHFLGTLQIHKGEKTQLKKM